MGRYFIGFFLVWSRIYEPVAFKYLIDVPARVIGVS